VEPDPSPTNGVADAGPVDVEPAVDQPAVDGAAVEEPAVDGTAELPATGIPPAPADHPEAGEPTTVEPVTGRATIAPARDEPAPAEGADGDGHTDPPAPRSWRSPQVPLVVWIGVAVLLVAAVAGLGWWLLLRDQGPPAPSAEELVAAVAAEYVAAWEAGDLADMQRIVVEPPATFVERHDEMRQDLEIRSVAIEQSEPQVFEGAATVPITITLDLAGLGPWRYQSRLALGLLPPDETPRTADGRPVPTAQAAPEWQVVWDSSTLHPDLVDDLRLGRTRQWPVRAPLLAVDGTRLTGEGAASVPSVTTHLLGSVRPLDAVSAAERGGRYVEGDEAGATGLEAAYESQLAGEPSGTVELRGGDQVRKVLHLFEGREPEAVRTTIDVDVQAAAEAAVGPGRLAALVALDAATGELRALVNRPVGGFNRAIDGAYPAGSTFKVVTTAALLAAGRTPDEEVPCPRTTTVGGRPFTNAGGFALGPVPLRTVFAQSCNTAFVELAGALDPAELQGAAERFGFNQPWERPIELPSGSFPLPEGDVDLAAAAIGQGRVTASPLQMAVVAATVASGEYRSPQVVVPDEPVAGEPLPEGVAPTLGDLMREVVADGTGTAAQVAGGEPVAGKTGTAEFGTGIPPRTHAWFIGFRGGIAVAVLVEDGGAGGTVAAPLAADFFSRLG
jgi:hypothetical protein